MRSAFGPQYEQLVELKRKYDPTNLFRLNQNIPPGTGEGHSWGESLPLHPAKSREEPFTR
jgi:Berberine and berberine like